MKYNVKYNYQADYMLEKIYFETFEKMSEYYGFPAANDLEELQEELEREADGMVYPILTRIKFFTADRETGTIIDWFSSIEEAQKAIEEYEEEDKKDGTYTANFYDIVDESHKSLT